MIGERRLLLACTAVSALLLAVGLVVVIANQGHLEAPLVFHVGAAGADFFGSVGDLYGLWALGVVIAAVNTFLGTQFFRSARPLTYVFFGANVFLAALLLIAFGTIMSMN